MARSNKLWTPEVAKNLRDAEHTALIGSMALAGFLALQNRKLRRESRTDPLTGVLNRRGLEADVKKRIRRGERLGALTVDVDHFKAVNDSLGHATGDVLLQTLADFLGHRSREHDSVVSRSGGDEFAFVACYQPRFADLDDGEWLHAMGSRMATEFRGLSGIKYYNEHVSPEEPLGLKVYYAEHQPNTPFEDTLAASDPKNVSRDLWAGYDPVYEAPIDPDYSIPFLNAIYKK